MKFLDTVFETLFRTLFVLWIVLMGLVVWAQVDIYRSNQVGNSINNLTEEL
jgi:hypothetical protein